MALNLLRLDKFSQKLYYYGSYMVTERRTRRRYPDTFMRDSAREKHEFLAVLQEWAEDPDRDFDVGQSLMDQVNKTIVKENTDIFMKVGKSFFKLFRVTLPAQSQVLFAACLVEGKITPIVKVNADVKGRKAGVESEYYMLSADFDHAKDKLLSLKKAGKF